MQLYFDRERCKDVSKTIFLYFHDPKISPGVLWDWWQLWNIQSGTVSARVLRVCLAAGAEHLCRSADAENTHSKEQSLTLHINHSVISLSRCPLAFNQLAL